MKKEDLYPGMKVRVISWEGDMSEDSDPYDYRPEHWCEDGGMDDWQEAVVTIHKCSSSGEYVYLEEDNSEWQWYPWDFVPYCNLPAHNPNKVYKRQAWKRRVDGIKKSGLRFDSVITDRIKSEPTKVDWSKRSEYYTIDVSEVGAEPELIKQPKRGG